MMNEMEIKMLIELDDTLDSVRKAREMGLDEAADRWIDIYNARQTFVRKVTGKKVIAEDYRAYFRED